jgi:hypothetical protein
MQRRTFLATAATAGLGMGAGAAEPVVTEHTRQHASYSLDANVVRFYAESAGMPLKAMFISDTHLWRDDARGESYRQYSGRMAAAYNETRHFVTGEPTNPEAAFESALQHARDEKADLLLLGGDIFSFPSEAAVDWAVERLDATGVPFLYVAGNHDWHYEGMEGTMDALRAEWTEKRLLPLYQGENPLMAAREVNGIVFLAIDNSTYEVRPEQLDFFCAHAASGKPMVLMMHIPLYAPGRPVGFGCGHPEWGAATDKGYELERRPRWPESGHSPLTLAFREEAFAAPNLLGILAGHIHRFSLDVVSGTPQFVTAANADGAYMDVLFLPA